MRKTLYAALGLATLLCLAAYALAALTAYAPAGWWIVNAAGLFYPLLLALVALLALVWLFIRWRWSMVCVLVTLAGFRSLAATFAFPSLSDAEEPAGSALTVMSYNVHEFRPVTGGHKEALTRFWTFICDQQPDVLCLQEMDNSHRINFMALNYVQRTAWALEMPYHYFSRDFYLYDSTLVQGTLILSRLPIVDSGRIRLSRDSASAHVIWADIVKGKDTVRVMTTHLLSFALNHADLEGIHRTEHLEQGFFSRTTPLLGRFRHVFRVHDRQAATLGRVVRQSPYPVIVCGDFNSVPNSHAYYEARGDLQDAFLVKGRGIGTTYSRLSRTLRIDYILTSPLLKVVSFRTVRRLLSDHYPVVARIALPRGR
jgi:endonuclease/exonuclease/phosphatase family metal-dependent hydrolase